MSIVKSEYSKKWINAFIAICSVLVAYVVIRFLTQMGEWFDLEAKVRYYLGIVQGIGIASGLATFLYILKTPKTMTYLKEVYGELVKVVWPDKETVIKLTVGIVIALSIVSGLFVLVDFIFRKILQLLY